MAGVEKVQFCIGQISQIGCCAIRREDLVVLAPDDQRRRLALAEERLEFRVERNVRPVVEKEVELNLVVALAVEQELIVSRPSVQGLDRSRGF